ncbi:MAG: hypothetical protein LUD57_00935 [Ruminococcus sp.]|nr:hypothetical protein [Ruminococcus sp.]
MEYFTTKLNFVKSYHIYQFHAFTANKKLKSDDIFYICILEVLQWLRRRLNNFTELPEVLCSPEPDLYNNFDSEKLCSFNINVGANIDCIYIKTKCVWSIRISEPDTGENLGTDTERLPVNGRTFQTEISFVKKEKYIEVGVRTTCSEPHESDAQCSAFRPMFVKSIAKNSNIGFEFEGFRLDGKPFMITK